MKQIVDARGLACPQPVVLAGKAMVSADQVSVIVDNAAAVENVTRLASSRGFAVEVSEEADATRLTLRREGAPAESTEATAAPRSLAQPCASDTVVFVPSDSLGRGPAELGERLLAGFLHTLLDLPSRPGKIVFMNTGVRLTVQGSPALDDLRELAEQGVDILACGTCLGYFELNEKLAVGRVSNMYEIAGAFLEAGSVVEL